jgi:hypothetical protein
MKCYYRYSKRVTREDAALRKFYRASGVGCCEWRVKVGIEIYIILIKHVRRSKKSHSYVSDLYDFSVTPII